MLHSEAATEGRTGRASEALGERTTKTDAKSIILLRMQDSDVAKPAPTQKPINLGRKCVTLTLDSHCTELHRAELIRVSLNWVTDANCLFPHAQACVQPRLSDPRDGVTWSAGLVHKIKRYV